ncbi:uncharacterized protein MONBRDRAFT_33402 [Monosiga brevicollis MX1]|uniref:3-hydroxyisobutyryl-CoA hydrolase n=1 Tax=Monosiga brevicollis TaxID=81824 RepID=A9V573_MONBE|nr:uncharacterized protein MONBRDRAFT_33402 [Monosiga brevicollis MX1]EDQ87329.1 predicted protein [Monosiga brevicollis MX1]|eukprot:XP_001747942.1 hypothetical protein [Monosiga brevicollis MX1]
MAAAAAEILVAARGRLTQMTLNRPKSLNALTLNMVRLMQDELQRFQASSDTDVMVLVGAGEKAFCAGGDVVQVAKSAKGQLEDDKDVLHKSFFAEEYILDHSLATSKKPVVAIVDGITMGGGVGISVHGPYCVATERTLFAMPETAIGLFPDVGGSHFLPRLSPGLGMYLALTGARLKGADVFTAGIASHFVPSSRVEALVDDLAGAATHGDVQTVLGDYHEDPTQTPVFAEHMEEIRRCFDVDALKTCLENLDESDWGRQQLETIHSMCPASVAVTFEQLQRGAALPDLRECLKMEYNMVQHAVAGDDFYNGVSSKLMKGPPVEWSHARVEDVTEADVAAFFKPVTPPLPL